MTHLLHHLGGVVIAKYLIFTEKLDWLETIKSNILVNTANPYAVPKFFAFFGIQHGSPPAKYNIKSVI